MPPPAPSRKNLCFYIDQCDIRGVQNDLMLIFCGVFRKINLVGYGDFWRYFMGVTSKLDFIFGGMLQISYNFCVYLICLILFWGEQ